MRIHTFTLAGAYVFLWCCLPAFGQMAQNNPSIHTTKASTDTDDTVAILPNALEVRIDPEFAPQVDKTPRSGEARAARTPAQLFADYCATKDVSDPRVTALFGELHDEVTAGDTVSDQAGELSPAG